MNSPANIAVRPRDYPRKANDVRNDKLLNCMDRENIPK